MKKIALGLAASALLALSIEAKDNVFIGVEMGVENTSTIEYSSGVRDPNQDEDVTRVYNTLRVGKYFNFGRLYFDLLNVSEIGINYDYVYDLNNDFGIYAGTGLSYSYRSEEQTNDNWEVSGLKVPLRIGGIYNISDSFELELGLKYVINNIEDKGDYGMDSEYDNSSNYYMSINYLF